MCIMQGHYEELWAYAPHPSRLEFCTGAEDETLRVCVEAHKLSLRTGKREPANLFHFIFRPSATAEPPESAPGGVDTLRQDVPPVYRREVLPETYEEGMLYLEGRRRWLNSLSEEGANACGVCVSEKD